MYKITLLGRHKKFFDYHHATKVAYKTILSLIATLTRY